MSSAKESEDEARDLANKLETYVLNLRQVEAALEIDPTHVDLITLKADLNELIDLTRNLLSESLPTKKTGTGSSNVPKPPHGLGAASSSSGAAKVDDDGPSRSSSSGAAKVDGPSRSSIASSTSIQPAAMISSIKALRDDQYVSFMIQAFDRARPAEMLGRIVKYTTKHQKKLLKREKFQPNQVDSDNENAEEQTGQCNGSTGPATKSGSAWNAPLIYRGDVLSAGDDVLYLNMKQIRLKPTLYGDHRIVAAIVCLVNSQKQLVFWGVVNWKREDICQTFPSSTGITIEKLEKGLPFQQVLSLFLMAIDGKLLVGYNLGENLQALSVSHDRKEDLADFFRDKDGPFALEDLNQSLDIGIAGLKANEELGNLRIAHEARCLHGLHLWKENNQSIYPVFVESPNLEELRKKRRDAKLQLRTDASESCQCKIIKLEK